MFKTKKSEPSNNSVRVKTNMSLTQLLETSSKKTSNTFKSFNTSNNKFKNNNQTNQTNQTNQKDKYSKKNMFYNKPKAIEKEFKIKIEEFPVLVETTQKTNEKTTQNYSEKLKATKIEQENYKMRISKESKKLKESKKSNNTYENISEYYNPKLSLIILNHRQEYREELNNILGDISPYWKNPIQEELSEYDDDELISENDDEYNYNIIEDW
jgi:hypothetical protein